MSVEAVYLLVMFSGLFAAILSGMPAMLAIAGSPLLVAGIGALTGHFDFSLLAAFPQRVLGMMNNQLFIALPLFIFMGVLMEKAGLARAMLAAAGRIGGGSRGSIGLSVLAISTLIAATTGIVGATIVMLATISYPALVRAGISQRLAGGLVVSAGTLGQIIPPSIVLIILADQISNAFQEAQRSAGSFSIETVTVSDVFAGALLPGLVLVALYGAYFAIAKGRVEDAKPSDGKNGIVKDAPEDCMQGGASVLTLLMPLFLILAVLGSIVFGVATPTEAASLGVAGTLLLAVFRKGEGGASAWLPPVLRETVYLSGMIFGIVLAASVLSLVFRGFEGDRLFAGLASALPGEKWGALLLVLLFVFIMGFVLEFIEIIFIVVPIAGPVLLAMDINPVWLAVLFALNLQTSFLTPPFGVALFYFKSVMAEKFEIAVLYRAVVPFVLLQLATLALVLMFPQLALFLPAYLFGQP